MQLVYLLKQLYRIFFTTFLITYTGSIYADDKDGNLYFIENKNQWDNSVNALLKTPNTTFWILNNGSILIDYFEKTPLKTEQSIKLFEPKKIPDFLINGFRFFLNFENTNASPIIKEDILPQYFNYFLGNNPDKFATNVHAYQKLISKNIYNGIDLIYYINKGSLRYDFILKPHADYNQILLNFNGLENLTTDSEGNIVMHMNGKNISMKELYVYDKETNQKIKSKWKLTHKNKLKLELGEYNHNHTIIIDPIFYTTYLAGNADDLALDIVANSSGEAYVSGGTWSTDFSTTTGAYQTTFNNVSDCFVSKLNSNGNNLIFSTFIGGSDAEYARSISLDNYGNAYITGYTNSGNYVSTPGCFQPTHGIPSAPNAFVTKINPNGNAIIYSTFIGGNNGDQAYSICVDNRCNAYIAGTCASPNFPVTPGAYKTTLSTFHDGFILKLDSSGSSLIFSTLFGGNGNEFLNKIIIDENYNVYATGRTTSTDFATTPGVVQTSPNFILNSGLNDGYILKLNNLGNQLIFATYFGGTDLDFLNSIQLDSLNNILVCGYTRSADFPVTAGAYQTIPVTSNNDVHEAFITKFNPNCTSILASTFLGGSYLEAAFDFVITKNNDVIMTGISGSYSLFPFTPTAYKTTNQSGEIFITRFNSSFSNIIFSTFFGGSEYEQPESICIDNLDNVYITGYTQSLNFPVTAGALQSVGSSTASSFVTKLGICNAPDFYLTHNNASCYGYNNGSASINLTGNSSGAMFEWQPIGSTTNSVSNLSAGSYSVMVSNVTNCPVIKTFTITQPNPVIASVQGQTTICAGYTATLQAYGGNSFLWNNGSNDSLIAVNPNTNTTYSVIVYNGSCTDTAYANIFVNPKPTVQITANDTVCLNSPFTLNASGANNYIWNNGASTYSIVGNSINSQSYTVIGNTNGCKDTATIFVNIKSLPIAAISGTNQLCFGSSETLIATGGNTYNWSTGSSSNSVTVSPTIATTYSVIAYNSFGCADTAFTQLQVNPLPTLHLNNDTTLCSGQNLTLLANGVGSIHWINMSFTNSIIVTPSITTVYTATSSNVCGNISDSVLVTILPLPNTTVSNDTTIFYGESAPLHISGNYSYYWSPNNSLSCYNCNNPIASPEVTTTYQVVITDGFGCNTTQQITVLINDNFDIFIPDIFSPNGDGINDVLYVRGNGIKKIQFDLFDRWGEKIFSSNSITYGWDGTYKGQALGTGAYVYQVKATLFNDKEITKKGDVTLIK